MLSLARDEERMLEYRIYILSAHGDISLAFDFQGPDDASAIEESKKYSVEHAVEIWQRARLVARINKGGATATG